MTPELILALALTAADASQTEWIAQHPENHREHNPLLGRHPSSDWVAGYFIVSSLALIAINQGLSSENARVLNYLWIGAEGTNITRNFCIGVRFSL